MIKKFDWECWNHYGLEQKFRKVGNKIDEIIVELEIMELGGGKPKETNSLGPKEKLSSYAMFFLANSRRGKDNLEYQKFSVSKARGSPFAFFMDEMLGMLGDVAFNGKKDSRETSYGRVYSFPGIYEQIGQPSDFQPQDWILLYKGRLALLFWQTDLGKWRLSGEFRIQNIDITGIGKDYNDVLY